MIGLILAIAATGPAASGAHAFMSLLVTYKYYAIFFLMLLESASLPIPSEVILPAIGYLAQQGQMNLALGALAAIAGSIVGFEIDYYIAYFIGKALVYKHLKFFHIKHSTLLAFEKWFENNGTFAVFIGRFIPIVRGLISFPAGLAEMPQKKFFTASLLGTVIWDVALILFGFYALHSRNIDITIAIIAVFCIILYAIYVYAIRRIRRSGKKARTLRKR